MLIVLTLSLALSLEPESPVDQAKPLPQPAASSPGSDLVTRIRAAEARIGQGACDQAARDLADLQAEASAMAGRDSELALEVLGSQALALECAGQSAQAMALAEGRYRQSLDRFGPDSWTTDTFRMLQAYRAAREGRVDEALGLMRASFDLRLRSPRANAEEREQLGALLGAIYRSRGRDDEAREVLALSAATGPAADLTALYSARGQGDDEAVIRVAARMLANTDLAPAIQHLARVEQVHALQGLGWSRRDPDRLVQAEVVGRQVLAEAGAKPESQASAARALGLTLTSGVEGYTTDARFEEGLRLLDRAVEISDAAFGPGVPVGVDSRLDLAARLQARDRSREAEAVLAPLVRLAQTDPHRLTPEARATIAVGQALAALDTQGLRPAYRDLRRAALQRQDMILARSSQGQGQQARRQFVDLFRAQIAFAWALAEEGS